MQESIKILKANILSINLYADFTLEYLLAM